MTTFRSKIDAWLILTLALAIGVVIYASMQVIFNAVPRNWWPLILIIGLGIGMPVWLLISTRYILQPKLLTVRIGPFVWRIPTDEITAITPTRSPLSSPALSLDRLRIEYGSGKAVMISPHKKAQFLSDIEAARHGA